MKSIILVISLSIIIVAFLARPTLKYEYAVRERISNSGSSIEWDQYCWGEYTNGHIDRRFVGHFKFNASVSNDGQFYMSQCSKNVVTN
jgi:hypothetical protein